MISSPLFFPLSIPLDRAITPEDRAELSDALQDAHARIATLEWQLYCLKVAELLDTVSPYGVELGVEIWERQSDSEWDCAFVVMLPTGKPSMITSVTSAAPKGWSAPVWKEFSGALSEIAQDLVKKFSLLEAGAGVFGLHESSDTLDFFTAQAWRSLPERFLTQKDLAVVKTHALDSALPPARASARPRV